jgi:hypothetical protein
MLNKCIIAGRIVDQPIAKGQHTRVLLFAVVTQQKSEKNGDIVSIVPCAWFGPSVEIEDRLTAHGKGQFIMFEGRINQSTYMVGQQTRTSTEVIVFPKSVVLDPEVYGLAETKGGAQ